MKYAIMLFCMISGSNVIGQQLDNALKAKTDSIINTSFSIPSIPALDFISADPEDISHPGTARELASSLYNGIDNEGRVKQGLAIEAKLPAIFGYTIPLETYRTNRLSYMAYNTQLSLGSIATSGDSTSTDLGWGIRVTIFDNTDLLKNQDFRRDAAASFLPCMPSTPTDNLSQEEIEECMAEAQDSIIQEYRGELWNESWMTIAYAGGVRLKGSMLKKGTESSLGHQVWLAGGLKLGTKAHLGYLAKWGTTSREELDKSLNELELGAKLLYGKSTFNIFAEAGYKPLLNSDDFETDPMVDPDKVFSWTIGLEFKVADGIWVTTGLGEEADKIVGQEGIQLLTGLKAGIANKARLR